MVLALLGTSITSAIQLDVITSALFQVDFNFKQIMELENKIKKIVNLDQLAAGHDERKIIKQAFFNELCKILDPGKPSLTPKKGKPSIVMFVGLQGSGKTTTCREYAYYHQKRGWKPAMVCVDTFRAGAFDQLEQNATKPTIPFYGSYKESDPVAIAVEGVKRFKEENHDLIIIDTSGGHKQEASLFEEMHQLYEATRPDLVIFVMDSSIGQAAFDQAQALKHNVAVGAVILTKMDGHAKGGGGALSGVAATKSPVISIGRGEHMDEFEIFEVKPFVRRLLGLMEKISRRNLNLTFRTMYEKYQYLLKTGPGPSREAYSLLLGFCSKCHEEETKPKVKRYMTMMDSMTNEELDSWNALLINDSRIIRIARDSGHQVSEVKEMLDVHKRQVKMDKFIRDKCSFNAQAV